MTTSKQGNDPDQPSDHNAQVGGGVRYDMAGVSIEAGDELVDAIKPAAQRTNRPGVMGGLGGFGALFDLKAAGFKDPVLVSCTDGVGTKLILAIETGKHDTIGIDLVAMCVNDLVVQGAQPLFFLDYLATGALSVEDATHVVNGIADACHATGCALVGGETAEMPGMYQSGHYDLGGFSVGAAERDALLPRQVKAGDTLVALPASGVHSNGFSLVRKIVSQSGHGWHDPAPFDTSQSLADALLTPTSLYVKTVMHLHRMGLISACAHITGGGLPGNLPRILPEGLGANIEAGSWPILPVFKWLAQSGPVTPDEMLKVFNCGIGMVLVTARPDDVMRELATLGEDAHIVGRLVESDSPFTLNGEMSFA